MSETADKLLKQALSLNEADRASLAGALIESLDPGADEDAARAWDEEIARRLSDLDSGTIGTVPWSEVRHRLFRGFE